MAKARKTRKHYIEMYKNYKIYAVSGISPALFIAEKDDPAKGITLCAENLEQLKTNVDALLVHAGRMHINVYDGPPQSYVVQNIQGRVTPQIGAGYDIVVVVNANYNLEELIDEIEFRTVRRSKKRGKKHKHNEEQIVMRVLYRSKTFQR